MSDPFALLGVDETADDEAIKRAYLQRVREHPPERAPEQFQAIRSAYEHIRDQRERLTYFLFHTEPPDPAVLAATLLGARRAARPSAEGVRRALRAGLERFEVADE